MEKIKDLKQQGNVNEYSALLEKFKRENIEYYTITTGTDVFYISDIPRNTLKKVGSLLESKPLKAYQIILNDIFLGGSRKVFDDADIFLSTVESVMSLLEPYKMEAHKNEDGNYNVTITLKERSKNLKEPVVKTCTLKKLSIQGVMDIRDRYDKGDIFGATEIILDKFWLTGDEDIKTNNRLFISILPVTTNMINIKQSIIKKKLDKYRIDDKTNYIRKYNAALRYYFNIDPDKLNEDEWCKRVTELEYILKEVNPDADKK